MGIINITSFVITSFLFIISPGIDTIFILNKSLTHGQKTGLYATLGKVTGVMVHTSFAAFGLSLILAQSATAFTIVKYSGAIYLVYIGITKLFSKQHIINKENQVKFISNKKAYWTALMTNALNPKVAIFFLAFIPQFIKYEYIHDKIPFFLLGAIYAMLSMIWFTGLTFFAATFSAKLKSNPGVGILVNKISGVAIIFMGIKVALTKK
ncbi:LysE family translocator [Chitinophaga arvensicola]|uniref:Threonine/homoserine/homoserine lactone efflux protein n=1 Tax=Chitinophaga arvensicola TaxID=29529 RepID=A0A1I0SCG6_9BACT|nr:LysE family translocator [Chitinophaga arvensicola]SEW53493.1 Threonine/homoserine/homoserine lactone efflux protein [Chitinophaga arvensicola]